MDTPNTPDNCPLCRMPFNIYKSTSSISNCFDHKSCPDNVDHSITIYSSTIFIRFRFLKLDIFYEYDYCHLFAYEEDYKDNIIKQAMPIPQINWFSKEDIINKFELFKTFT